ncbi:MAG: hypothetical protein H0V17_07325 [Deltaproteobacteria bacterium]|nr:hypothetical protein [Deltaproteobacteria bacterium]
MRLLILAVLCITTPASAAPLLAPPPTRTLASPSKRPAATGPSYYVSPSGDDAANGSQQRPWKTVARGISALKAGDTLYLRGGVYFEAVTLTRSGTASAPITIRSAPNELATIDAGIREFLISPKTAWEPVAGSRGEYRSTATYPTINPKTEQRREAWVTGHFADKMIPLHGYLFSEDLRASNVYWNVPKLQPSTGVYLGPGLWFDSMTKRIHGRFSGTGLKSVPDYSGLTDPRTLSLSVALDRTALRIDKARHVRIHDLVLRGSVGHTLHIEGSDHVELDGLAVYGGAPAVFARSTSNVRLAHSLVRGTAAPWSSRPSMKYRGQSPYLVVVDGALPQSARWEIAHNEFTDGHDGIVVDSIKTLRFHHNLVDNFNDDALYLTLAPRAALPDDVHIYENVFSRTFTALAFGDRGDAKGGNTIGAGFYVFRNLFDLRQRTFRAIPGDADDDTELPKKSENRLCGDHGSPVWDPVFFYQNTVITEGKPWRDYYGATFIQKVKGSKRRLFNNVFVHVDGEPGMSFQGQEDLQVDGNLHWSLGSTTTEDFLGDFRSSNVFEASKTVYAPGWAAHDVYADPRFRQLAASGPIDIRPQPGSGAIDKGVTVPVSWPDTLRTKDAGKPDIGALPASAAMPVIGP